MEIEYIKVRCIEETLSVDIEDEYNCFATAEYNSDGMQTRPIFGQFVENNELITVEWYTKHNEFYFKHQSTKDLYSAELKIRSFFTGHKGAKLISHKQFIAKLHETPLSLFLGR